MDVLPLYIVILNWNLFSDTADCIESVLAGRVDGVKILVIDNGSTDGSPELLTERFSPNVQIIHNEHNEGYAVGNNIGIRYVLTQGAQSILILNNDTLIDPMMLRNLLAVAETHKHIHLFGPAIYFADRPREIWHLGDRYSPCLHLPRAVSDNEISQDLIPVDFLTGCAMLVRREVFETIGLFDPEYRLYFEDADFCERARSAGFHLACVPAARMWHKVSRSAIIISRQSRYNQSLGRVKFYRSIRLHSGKLSIDIYLIFKTGLIMLKDLVRGRFDLIWASIRGACDGARAANLDSSK